MLSILIDTDGVGILHTTRQQHGIVLIDAHSLESVGDGEVVGRFVMVPAFDGAGLGREDIDLHAGLLEGILGAGQFDLFETIGNQNSDAFAIEGSCHR